MIFNNLAIIEIYFIFLSDNSDYKYNDEGKLVYLEGEKSNASYEYIESIKYDKYGKRTQIEYG
ncbi:MAG: hypothetical protein KBB11_10525, partial [Bacteroidales bacterium]|nr:hypothetical protein [Bacteroidales bacterium]